jgi:integrase
LKLSAVKLTDSYLGKLKAGTKPGSKPEDKPAKYCIWDNLCPGFGVEVTPAGGKLLVVKTCQRGVRGWHTLGRWPMLNVEDARAKAYKLKDQVRQGEDPRAAIEAKKAEAAAQKLELNVTQLADRFIEEHIQAKVTLENGRLKVVAFGVKSGNKESTAKEHVRLIEKHIKPALGHFNVKEVGTAHIAEMLFKIRKATPIQANRVRSVLGKMFDRAELWGLRPTGSNPVPAQDRVMENKRERNLSDEEIQALGKALRQAEAPTDGNEPCSPWPIAAVRLAILTGMRKGEILGLRWEWVDLDQGTVTIPAEDHKTGRKTGKVRIVRLCATAKTILRDIQRKLGNPFVIPGHVLGQALVNIQDPWEELRETAGLDFKKAWLKAHKTTWDKLTAAQQSKIEENQPHFHDLRRTFASVGARMGFPELWIGGLLGHSAGTVTAGYARVNQDPLREAVEAIGGRIAELLSGAKVSVREPNGSQNMERSIQA